MFSPNAYTLAYLKYRRDSFMSRGAYLLEMMFRVGAYSMGGLNRGQGLTEVRSYLTLQARRSTT